MDLSLLGRVLWRHKVIVLFGVIVAFVAAVLSVYRFADGALEARVAAQYESNVRLLVTDVPVYQSQDVRQLETGQQPVRGLAVSQLAGTYPYVIMSDAVLGRVTQRIEVPADTYEVEAYRRTVAPNANQNATLAGDNSLPIIEVQATATSRALAERVASTTAQTFIEVLIEQQDSANLPADERVSVTQLGVASRAVPVGSSPFGLQMIVFAGVLTMFVLLAFARHNVRSTRLAQPSMPRHRKAFASDASDEFRVVDGHSGGDELVDSPVPASGALDGGSTGAPVEPHIDVRASAEHLELQHRRDSTVHAGRRGPFRGDK